MSKLIDHNLNIPLCIFGGSGNIGQYLISELINRGYTNINLFLRNKSNIIENKKLNYHYGDFSDISDFDKFIQINSVVINLIYINKDDNLDFFNKLIKSTEKKRIKKLIHISSSDVIGRSNEQIIDEQSICQPYTKYAINKFQIENLLINECKNNKYIILRCNSVIGGGALGFAKLVNQVTTGSKLKNFILSCLHNKRPLHLIHIFNVISAIIFFIEKDNKNSLYYLSQDEEHQITYIDLQYEIAKFKKVDLFNKCLVPDMRLILSFLLIIFGKNSLTSKKIIKGNLIKQEGFNYPIKFLDSLSDSLENS